ncbi:ankyrin repeat domain-containing protein [Candidatus Babeliales bacterium]|nr:ankyrin repeat domain-containing protein [Candidatus Babeliales bacterium]
MILRISKAFVFIFLLSANVFAATAALESGWRECAAKMAQLSIYDNAIADKVWKETPLHRAARKNDADAIYLMVVMQKAAINARDAWGRTPLHHAANWPGHEAAFDQLIALGADRYARDKDGKLAWPNKQMLWAAKAGDLEEMKKLYALGANVDVKICYSEGTGGFSDPENHVLHLLVVSRAYDALRWACCVMQQQGKSVDVDNGRFGGGCATPLHYAAYHAGYDNNHTAYNILLEFGADQNKSNYWHASCRDFYKLGLKEGGRVAHSAGGSAEEGCLIL